MSAKKIKKESVVVEDFEDLGINGKKRGRAKLLLLNSHMKILEEVFMQLDKYKDQILRRSDFLMALRTDEKVIEFINQEAIRTTGLKPKTLTLDQVLVEIERDETYQMQQFTKEKDAINHKQFITWNEFLQYFIDFRDIEDRNKLN